MEKRKKTPYLGSVRFFKHLILGTVGLLIAIPTSLCILFAAQNMTLRAVMIDLPDDPPQVTPTPVPRLPEFPRVPTLHTEPPAWQALYPDLYAPPAQRSTVDPDKVCYLTFDDGPSARTPEILAILEEYGVKATFFVQGKTDEQSKQWMRDIVAGGHTLGMHTYSHDYKKIYASVESFLEDCNNIYNLIYEATGAYPTISRFPGGSINGYNGGVYESLTSEMVRRGFVYFDWNVAAGDAVQGRISADTLVNNALSRIDSLRRTVVLMHDSKERTTTVAALPAIIEGYQNAGFTMEALTPEVVPVVY